MSKRHDVFKWLKYILVNFFAAGALIEPTIEQDIFNIIFYRCHELFSVSVSYQDWGVYHYLFYSSLEVIGLSLQLLPAIYFCATGTWYPDGSPFVSFSIIYCRSHLYTISWWDLMIVPLGISTLFLGDCPFGP